MNILKIIAHFKAVSWVICKLYHNIAVMLGRFSRVWLCATPQSAAHQTPLSLGFSRQEHWSGLPFPSPVHESEKWTWSRSVVSDPQRPHGLQPTRLLRPWDFPGKSTGVGCHCLLCGRSLLTANPVDGVDFLLSFSHKSVPSWLFLFVFSLDLCSSLLL